MRVECESQPPFRVLVVEDEPVAARLLRAALEALGGEVRLADGVREALRRIEGEDFALALLDLALPDGGGLELLPALCARGVPAIVQTASDRAERAVEAMRAGAEDFIVKPVTPQRLAEAVARVLRCKPDEARPAGASPMARTLQLADKVARSDVPVLLTGETGVGKEWLARRIVRASGRAEAPFLVLNCAALPAELAESLLFGHERGSFSGAADRHAGRFAEAHGGTLLLDEIGELPLALQAKLLRVLESGEIDTVGARRPRRVDVRVVAATHRDLAAMAQAGTFRADLYWRLAVFEIAIPPLRARRDEIEALALRFAAEAGGSDRPLTIAPPALARLRAMDWPGNIRELRHAVQRAAILAEGAVLHAAAFGWAGDAGPAPIPPAATRRDARPEPAADPFRSGDGCPRPLAEIEREAILQAVHFHAGSLSAAARSLRISRSTLYRKMEAYGLATPSGGAAATRAGDFTGR